MATKTIETITDDLDGTDGATHVAFAFDGVNYEIDLSEKNLAKLEKALAPFVEAGRKVTSGRRSTTKRASSPAEDYTAVREWATAQGLEVSPRGRIKAEIIDAYKAAQAA